MIILGYRWCLNINYGFWVQVEIIFSLTNQYDRTNPIDNDNLSSNNDIKIANSMHSESTDINKDCNTKYYICYINNDTFAASEPKILIDTEPKGMFFNKKANTKDNTPSMPLHEAHLEGFFMPNFQS